MLAREGGERGEHQQCCGWNASGREDIFTAEADKEIGKFAWAETSSASSRYLDSLEEERKTIAGTYLGLCALNEFFLIMQTHSP